MERVSAVSIVSGAVRELVATPDSVWVTGCPNKEGGRTIEVNVRRSELDQAKAGEHEILALLSEMSRVDNIVYTLKIKDYVA